MRSLSPAQRRARRLRVVALRSAGCSYAAIAAQTGLSRTGVFNICKRIESAGAPALDDAPNLGRRSRLNDRQADMVCATIVAHTPDQLALAPLLWTPAVVTQWIELRTGVRLSMRNTALKLRRWGFAPPRPLVKARLRDAAAAARWWAAAYPAVAVRARAEGAEIGWVDVSRLLHPPTIASAASQTAPASVPARSVFSTVDNRGRMRWATFAGRLDAVKFLGLLRRRLHGADRKLLLILDPLAARRSAQVRQWLAEHEDSVEVIDLPR